MFALTFIEMGSGQVEHCLNKCNVIAVDARRRYTGGNQGATMDERVQHVIGIIENNLRRDVPIDELAKAVNLSASRLRYLFATEVGTSPAQYVKALRMAQAKELLETTFLKTKEIIYCVGVSDESHFVRDFKKAYGLPPARYRAFYFDICSKTNKANQE